MADDALSAQWSCDLDTGKCLHLPTGLLFILETANPQTDRPPAQRPPGYEIAAQVVTRSSNKRMGPGRPLKIVGRQRWHMLLNPLEIERAVQVLQSQHDVDEAGRIVSRITRDAGYYWLEQLGGAKESPRSEG